jgi:hypothetical protein
MASLSAVTLMLLTLMLLTMMLLTMMMMMPSQLPRRGAVLYETDIGEQASTAR